METDLSKACRLLHKGTVLAAKLLIMAALKLNDKGKFRLANDKATEALGLMENTND
jgi:hypothetical protein